MKICIVCPRLCHGGAERVAVSLANGFVERGHKVMFFTNLQEEQTYILDAAVHVQNLTPPTNIKLIKWGGAIKSLRMKLKKDKPDVIIGVMGTCSFISKLGTIGLDIPVIATEHNSFERPTSAPMTIKSYFCKFYVNKIYNHVTVLTSADKFLLGNRLKHTSVMSNPLFLSQLHGKPTRVNSILAAGRLDDWHYKGFDVLIRAWARVVSSLKFQSLTPNHSPKGDGNYGWKLKIAGTGSGESLNYLKQLCKENGVEESIEFLGFRKDVEKLYQESSIFVLSSRYEGFGLVLIEAMSQGCACIACDYKGRQREILAPNEGECLDSSLKFQDSSVDGQKESEDTYVSNSKISQKQETAEGPQTRNLKPETRNRKFEACDTGILCEPDNVEALADAMVKMIEDDEYRESVRAKAIERSNYYSIENTMDRWEALLKQVTGVKQL